MPARRPRRRADSDRPLRRGARARRPLREEPRGPEPAIERSPRNPAQTADIVYGVVALLLIPLFSYFIAQIFFGVEKPPAVGAPHSQSVELDLSREAADAYMERCDFLFRENYLELFLPRFERLMEDRTDPEKARRAAGEWGRGVRVLGHIKAQYEKILDSIEKGSDPRLHELRSTVGQRLERVKEEERRLRDRNPFPE